MSGSSLADTLPAPERHPSIPMRAQWLAGEGAGSWFSIDQVGQNFTIVRYSTDGNVECEGEFESDHELDLFAKYKFVHLSHCQQVSIQQYNRFITLKRVE